MQRLAMCQRLQGRSTRQIRGPLQIRPAAPSCTRSSAAIFCMSLRGAKRRGNPFSLRQHKAKRNYSRQIRRSCGFALSIANLLSFPAGLRIATPRCPKVRHALLRPKARAGQRSLRAPLPAKGAPLRGPRPLVRNDMQKAGTWLRL